MKSVDVAKINQEIECGDEYLRGLMARLLTLNAPSETLQYVTQAISALSYAYTLEPETLLGGLGAFKRGIGGYGAAGAAIGARVASLRKEPEEATPEESVTDRT